MSLDRRLPAPALVVGGIVSVQLGAAVATRLMDRAGPSGVVFLRLSFAALFLCLIARPRFSGRRGDEWKLLVAYGVVLGLMNWSFYQAVDRIPLGAAVTIEFIGPLGVAVAGSRKPLDLVWVLLAGTGVVLLAGGGLAGVTGVGVAFAATAGGFWAAYILLAQRVGAQAPGLGGLAISMLIGALVLLPAGLINAGGKLADPVLLVGVAGVALLSSVIPYSLELMALRRLATAAFGVLMSLEPAVAALAGAVVLGQQLVPREVVAIGCVMAASVGATLAARREPAASRVVVTE